MDIKEYKNLQRNSTCLGPRQNSYFSTYVRLSWSDLLLAWISLSFRSDAVLVQQVNFKFDNLTEKCCIVGSPLLALCFHINNSVLLKTSYILHWKLHTSQIHLCTLIFTTTYYCSNSADLNKTVTRELLIHK